MANIGDIVASIAPGEWYEIPGTNMSAVFPPQAGHPAWGTQGPASITLDWGGGAFDTKRNRLIITGGGHNNYGGNEVYEFWLSDLSWHRVTDPSPNFAPHPDGVDGHYIMTDGTPLSAHTYDGLLYIPTVDRFMQCFGPNWYKGDNTDYNAHLFDLDTNTWAVGAQAPKYLLQPASAWDSKRNRALYVTQTGIVAYDPVADTWTSITTAFYYQAGRSAEYDPVHDILLLLGSGTSPDNNRIPIAYYDLAAGGGLHAPPVTGAQVPTFRPGLVYDTRRNIFVIWNGERKVTTLDPATWIAVDDNAATGPAPTQIKSDGTTKGSGIFSKWQYSPDYDIFIAYNDTSDNVWLYKPSSGTAGGGGTTPPPGSGNVLYVGPNRQYKKPSEAAAVVQEGDTVLIDPGDYVDGCVWPVSVTIKGNGGVPSVGGYVAESKGVWVVQGAATVIENIKLQNAVGGVSNAAAIRHEGLSLILRNCEIYGCHNGILTSHIADASLEVYDTHFHHMWTVGDLSHNIYCGKNGRLIVRGCFFEDNQTGHFIKSLSAHSTIEANRLVQLNNLDAALIDLWGDGTHEVVGNAMMRGIGSVYDFVQFTYRKYLASDGIWYPEAEIPGRIKGGLVAYNTVLFSYSDPTDPRWSALVHYNYPVPNLTVANNVVIHCRDVVRDDNNYGFIANGGQLISNLFNKLWDDSYFTDSSVGDLRPAKQLPAATPISFVPTLQPNVTIGADLRDNADSVGSYGPSSGTAPPPDDGGGTTPPPPDGSLDQTSLDNIAATMPPGTWYELPNTKLSSVYAITDTNDPRYGLGGPGSVVTQYSGAALDPDHGLFLVTGGGDTSYGGNEVYAFSLQSLTWSLATTPSAYTADPAYADGKHFLTSDGAPVAAYTYDGLCYLPNLKKMFRYGGSTWQAGDPAGTTYLYDPVTKTWQTKSSLIPVLESATAYDPGRNIVYVLSLYQVLAYHVGTDSWEYLTGTISTIATGRTVVYHKGTDRLYQFTGDATPHISYMDCSMPGDFQLVTTTGADFPTWRVKPAYDSKRDLYVSWDMAGGMYTFDPHSWAVARVDSQSGVAPPAVPSLKGVYGKLQYLARQDAFIAYDDPTGDVWLYKAGDAGSGPSPGWGNPLRRVKLTVPAAKVTGSLTGFQAPILRANLPDEMFDPAGSSAAQVNGGDIRITLDKDGLTRLPIELVEFTLDSTKGAKDATVVIWVKIPSLSSAADTDIYVWYHSAAIQVQPAADEPYGRNAVWDNHIAAYHLTSATQATDSTGNGYDFPVSSAQHHFEGPFLNGGKGSLGVISTTTALAPSMALDQDYTLRFVMRRGSTLSVGKPAVTVYGLSQRAAIQMQGASATGVKTYVTDNTGAVITLNGGDTLPDGTWCWRAISSPLGAGTQSYYVDGALASSVSASRLSGTGALKLEAAANNIWYGEFLIAKGAYSADRVATDYQAFSSPASFFATGTPMNTVVTTVKAPVAWRVLGAAQVETADIAWRVLDVAVGNVEWSIFSAGVQENFPNAWHRQVQITVNPAKIAGGALAGFPVLLTRDNLPDEMCDPSSPYRAQFDGGDIRVVSDPTFYAGLPAHVVAFEYDSASGAKDAKVAIWVKASISTFGTSFYIFYCADGYRPQRDVTHALGRNVVWSEFIGAWPVGNSVSVITDATGQGHDIAISDPLATIISGLNNRPALQLNAVGAGTTGLLDTDQDYSLFVTVRRHGALSSYNGFARTDQGGTGKGGVKMQAGGTADTYDCNVWDNAGAAHSITGNVAWPDNAWQHYGCVTARESNAQWAYVNGIDVTSAFPVRGAGDRQLTIGSTNTSAFDHAGVFIFKGLATSGWVATQYNNQSDPASFSTAGTPEAHVTTTTAYTGWQILRQIYTVTAAVSWEIESLLEKISQPISWMTFVRVSCNASWSIAVRQLKRVAVAWAIKSPPGPLIRMIKACYAWRVGSRWIRFKR